MDHSVTVWLENLAGIKFGGFALKESEFAVESCMCSRYHARLQKTLWDASVGEELPCEW